MKHLIPVQLAVVLLLVNWARAQVAAVQQEEVLLMNPFTVATDKDSGYAASSTLAGTRLNTPLRDIAAAVTIITPEYMADLGVFTLQDAIGFTPNAELNVATFNTANNGGESARIRGVRVGESTQDFFPNLLPIDIYNVEQISVNRGPNSLLFGVGNPAGTLTGISKRANFSNRLEVAGSVDQESGWRGTLDVNRVLVSDRVAFRFAALHRDTESFIQPAYWKEDRAYFAATARLLTRRNWSATLRAHVETAQADRVLPNLRTATDVITPWIDTGSNLVAGVQPAPANAVLPAGVIRASGVNQLVIVDGSPTPVPMLNWINTTRGGINGYQNRTLSTHSPIPYDLNYNGPTRASDYSGRSYRFFLEQELGAATSVELAYGQTLRDIYWVRSDGGELVFVDTNRTLPNGNPNPNAGRYYVQGTNRFQDQREFARQLRLTASHVFDFSKISPWIGLHRLAILASRDYALTGLNDHFEINETPLPGYPARYDNAQNRISRRSYLFQGAGNVWLSNYKFRDIPLVNEGGVRSRYFLDRPLRTDERTRSFVLAAQSKTLKGRLATTLGYRWDKLNGYSIDSALSVRNALGEAPAWQTVPLIKAPTTTMSNGTFTGGAVLHILPQLSLQYNQSETSTGAGAARDMYAKQLPVSTGDGEDYGIKFALFEGKLTGTLTRFTSSQKNQQISSVQGLGASLNDIGRTLNIPVLEAVFDPRDTQDIVARGYEFEMIYNPSKAWRISANFSRNNNVLSNVNSRAARFLEDNVYPLEAQYGSTILANGQTVSQAIVNFRNSIRNTKTAVEGRQAEVLREWTGNLVTNYRISAGSLKGLSFGGNVQYRGPSVIGAIVNPTTNIPDFAHPIRGTAYTLLAAHVRYERRIFGRYDWELSLHVRNLLDDYPLISRFASATDGAVLTYQQLEPRTWMLSSSVRF